MKNLYLIDAYAMIFRAYYSMGNKFMYNSKKLNVTAIYGVTRAIWQLIKSENPSHLAVVFDHKSPNIRVQEFEYYKAQRDATPEDIIISEPYIRAIVEAMNIPILEVEGYEADDVIGTLAKVKEKEGYMVYMVTPDKDFAQLVSPNIKIYKPSRQGSEPEIIGVPEVLAQWQVDKPEQVIDILALWGDAVDNIPGIPGIGEKTSKELIKKYGSVESLIAHANELKGKQKENVINFAQQGLDSKKLATIITDVPISVSDEEIKIKPFDKEKLREIFADLEFRSLQKEILGETMTTNYGGTSTSKAANITSYDLFSSAPENAEEKISIASNFKKYNPEIQTYTLVDTPDKFNELIEALNNSRKIAFDTETTSLNAFELQIVGISFCTKPNTAYYFPLPDTFEAAQAELKKFETIFSNPNILKIAQNLKFDLKVLNKYGIEIAEPIYDTMLAHYLIDSDSKHNMDLLSRAYLNYAPISYQELIGKGKSQVDIKKIPLESLTTYAAEDADVTYQLYQTFDDILTQMPKSNELLKNIEIPLIYVLNRMETRGVRIDLDFLESYSTQLSSEIELHKQSIYDLAEVNFNLDSPKQLGEVLFEKMGIPYSDKKTKTGQYATGEDVLQKLKKEHKIIEHILEYRELTKLKSTYVDAFPKLIEPSTGRIHTSFNQSIAATGRLSSTDPNLQNIPIRTERGKLMRKAFIAQNDDYLILSADYSQIELRLIAELSGDETMIQAFVDGVDIHTLTASKVLNIPIQSVTKEQRNQAKVVNFGIIYGVSSFGLSQQTSLSTKEAKIMIQNYFETYPKIKSYMDQNIEFGRANGYVETMMGRRRYLRDINSRNAMMRGVYERIAINAPVQGSAADMIKKAMIDIDREIIKRKLKSFLTIQVHDELLFEVHHSEKEEMQELVINLMQNAIPGLKVPIIAEYGFGANWLEAH